jgi:hypothetical protein
MLNQRIPEIQMDEVTLNNFLLKHLSKRYFLLTGCTFPFHHFNESSVLVNVIQKVQPNREILFDTIGKVIYEITQNGSLPELNTLIQEAKLVLKPESILLEEINLWCCIAICRHVWYRDLDFLINTLSLVKNEISIKLKLPLYSMANGTHIFHNEKNFTSGNTLEVICFRLSDEWWFSIPSLHLEKPIFSLDFFHPNNSQEMKNQLSTQMIIQCYAQNVSILHYCFLINTICQNCHEKRDALYTFSFDPLIWTILLMEQHPKLPQVLIAMICDYAIQ